MAGVMPQQFTVPFPVPVPAPTTTTSNPNPHDASSLNLLRVAMVMERFKVCLQDATNFNPAEFCGLCLYLARGIDYAVANSEISPRASEMPMLFKQVYQHKSDNSLQAAIMLLMISVKGACKSGWFTVRDADELLKLTNELGSLFYSTESIQPESSNASLMISKIMSRYYPRMKMGHILASLEIKPGYGAYGTDFDIPKKLMTEHEKLHLFVARMDNTETSSCIVSPPLVNFLLNGRGVDGRTNMSMDNGPQFPTNVTSMLRYGTNLLQAIGPFNGDYFVAVVVMSVMSSSEVPVLQDYARPLIAAHNSDTDIIEGSSRISINCPISLKHIKTPVKGHLCKHHQCFDYDNFVEINLRRPSWRCPQCSQSVCYTDIRIDQFMAKVLREVGDGVTEVIISTDGSFQPVNENRCQQDMSEESESSKGAGNIVDLTTGVMDTMDPRDTWDMEDRKPAPEILQSFALTSTNATPPLEVNGTHQVQDTAPPVGDIWAGILSACSNSFGMSTGVSDPPADSMMSNVPRDIVALTLDQLSGVSRGGSSRDSSVSMCQDQFSTPTSTRFQPSPIGNPAVQAGVGSALTRNVARILIAGGNVTEMQQQFSARSSMNHPQSSGTASTAMQPHLLRQLHVQNSSQNNINVLSFSSQQIVGLPATTQVPNSHHLHNSNITVSQSTQLPNMYMGPFTSHFTNQQVPLSTSQPPIIGTPNNFLQRQQSAYQSSPRSTTPPFSTMVPSSHIPQPNIRRGLQGSNSQHVLESSPSMQSRLAVAAQQASSMARVPPVTPVQLGPARMGSNVGEQRTRGTAAGVVQSVSRTEDLVEFLQEQGHPMRRMRGSLAGRVFPAQYVIQPTQGVQPARPPPPILAAQSAVHQPLNYVE
ncbi:E4 SUMO-protein ligase PIAL2-like isoform X1 [Papaver somniferum]|uniref:E4 SUMO-protein ligase PIAL2-like isoform X1 n=1 Tax=Papaver somniferum TaxID=3469 RepID=UPI000E6F48AB|nr:E4 SUMO-protein ligase PIAL2-like isoform X1 [Papaver somniferum]